MPEAAKKEAKTVYKFFSAFLKWLIIAGLTGAVGGVVGSVFNISVARATALREANPWLLFLLPAGGIVIAAIYHFTKMENVNTNTLIDSVHLGEKVPVILVPVIFLGTVITHICGGSAGREGAALQIGGGIGGSVGQLFRLDEKDMRLATLCGMSAVFSALFGTPLTAALFALEVISVGVFYYSGLVPCIVSAVTAYGVSRLFGIAPTRFIVTFLPLNADLLWRVAVMAILCAIMSSVFCLVMHGMDFLAERYLKNKFFRAAIGGVIVLGLTWLVGTTDYNGAGVGPITDAIEKGIAIPDAFLWKLLFTAISLGCGFRGGEVVPTFFVGATLGCVVGPILGIPAGFAAAVGLVAVFCGAVNCPIASIVLSVELFGSVELTYFAVACGIAYMLSGYFGIYRSQKILYSKIRPEFINIQAK
ncbi:MAG TPA: chloride channel protein [Oscillospiraceae bacterium]|nr:chloride channel protein [Oscillospiraceae bacterium]